MLDLFLKSLPPLLVVGGWVVVYYVQALQNRRKLLREEADKARSAVTSLLEDAVKFHTDTFSPSARLKVLAGLNDIERRANLLPAIASKKKAWGWLPLPKIADPTAVAVDAELIVRLRQSITLEHFDDPNAAPLGIDAQQLQLMVTATAALHAAIDKALIASLD